MADRRAIPNDICRCHDDKCPLHKSCLRWLDRARSNNGGLVVAAMTLNNGGECKHYMEATND